MRRTRQISSGGFYFTPLSKMVLIALVSVYILQLLAESWLGLPVIRTLAWMPFGAGFEPWQPFTAFLLNGSPTRAFSCVSCAAAGVTGSIAGRSAL